MLEKFENKEFVFNSRPVKVNLAMGPKVSQEENPPKNSTQNKKVHLNEFF